MILTCTKSSSTCLLRCEKNEQNTTREETWNSIGNEAIAVIQSKKHWKYQLSTRLRLWHWRKTLGPTSRLARCYGIEPQWEPHRGTRSPGTRASLEARMEEKSLRGKLDKEISAFINIVDASDTGIRLLRPVILLRLYMKIVPFKIDEVKMFL